MFLISTKRIYNYYLSNKLDESKTKNELVQSLFIKPYSAFSQAEQLMNFQGFSKFKMQDITFYMANEKELGVVYDIIPATSRYRFRYQPIETIELRGTTLQEGFRPKKEYQN